MIHWIATAVSTYLLHPLRGDGYQWWSGAGSDLGEATLVVAVLGVVKHHNCHHKGCPLPGHRHPKHGWPACRKHWNDTPDHVEETA